MKHEKDPPVRPYRIIDTPMWPCRWKIVLLGNWRGDNSFTEYFRTIEGAEKEIGRRGGEIRM
jgi:hypothetical protein